MLRTDVTFDAVKVFSSTMATVRDQLGDTVTAWLASHPEVLVTELVVTQSSDARFHCVTITVFFRRPAV